MVWRSRLSFCVVITRDCLLYISYLWQRKQTNMGISFFAALLFLPLCRAADGIVSSYITMTALRGAPARAARTLPVG
jgi:hypothetical protein